MFVFCILHCILYFYKLSSVCNILTYYTHVRNKLVVENICTEKAGLSKVSSPPISVTRWCVPEEYILDFLTYFVCVCVCVCVCV
jgi:hypothetical protein